VHAGGVDKVGGTASIDLQPLLHSWMCSSSEARPLQHQSVQLQLSNVRGKHAGYVHLTLRFKPAAAASRQQQHHHHHHHSSATASASRAHPRPAACAHLLVQAETYRFPTPFAGQQLPPQAAFFKQIQMCAPMVVV